MSQLAVGDVAPDFTLTDQHGDDVRLQDLRGRGLVVFCYPAAMTPGCTTQACDFRDQLDTLRAGGFEVVGISPDAPARLAQFADQEQLTYRLLSDPDHRVLSAWGAYGERTLYGKTVTGVIRSTVVLDPQGRVVWARYNVKATGHVAMLTRELGLSAS